MAEKPDIIRVAITQIPDIHLLPGWDRQFQLEHPIDLEVARVNSRAAHALLSGESGGEPFDVAIIAEEPTLAEYPTEAYERVLVGIDTFSLVFRRDDDAPALAAVRAGRPYIKHAALCDLLLALPDHALLMRERGAGLNVYIYEHLLGGLARAGNVGAGGCRLLEEERTNEALVGGLFAGERRISIVPKSVLRGVTLPRGRFDVLPVVHAPFRPYFMIRRRDAEIDPRLRAAIDVLWDFLLDFVGGHHGPTPLGTTRAPLARRPDAVLLGIDVVKFSLMRQEHQRAAARLLNSVAQEMVASIEPVRRALWRAISTGDGLILVLDGDLDPSSLLDATIEVNMGVRQLFETLGRNLGVAGGMGARMAIHAGPVLAVYDPGDTVNFVGRGVNTLQRILEFGNAGQVIATDEGLAALSSAEGFGAVEDEAWQGWDKHGTGYQVHSIRGPGFGVAGRPERLDYRLNA